MWYWKKNRYLDQWNIIGNPEVDPDLHNILYIYSKKQTSFNREIIISINGAGKTGCPYAKVNKQRQNL